MGAGGPFPIGRPLWSNRIPYCCLSLDQHPPYGRHLSQHPPERRLDTQVFFRQANGDARPVRIGRMRAADIDALRTQRSRKFRLRLTRVEEDEVGVRVGVRQVEAVQHG